ncbi:hypothetical protein [Bacillus pumilus]|uniref:hypothetical protein n=1 Tax=Bacillus pumilus TaxID=1408 RepID=UPI003000576E
MRVLVRDIKYLIKAGVLKWPFVGLIIANLFIYLLSRSNGDGEFVNKEFIWVTMNVIIVTIRIVEYIMYWKPMIQAEIDELKTDITNSQRLKSFDGLRRKFDKLR